MANNFYAEYPIEGGNGVLSLNGEVGALSLTSSGGTVTITTPTTTTINLEVTTPISAIGNLTDVGTDGIVITGGTGAVIGSGTSIAQHIADASHNGYLSSTDWNTFNNKQSTLTIGNLTDAGTDGITVTGGTGAVIGSGTSLSQHVADTTHNGYLSSTDWNTFNGKQAAGSYITALTGDVTASGPGSAAASVAKIQGTAVSGTTGTTNVVFSSGPTLSNPIVGTQSASDNSTKAASTAYVTSAIATAVSGINPAIAVQAATTTASDTSSYTYNNGVSGIGATLTANATNTALTIDGFTFTALGQRLLVKNDTQSPSGAYNGIYYVTQLQALALPVILTRALDYDSPSDMNNTGAIPVINGTVNGTTSWVLTSQIATVGADPLTFTKFTRNPADYLLVANNLSDVASKSASFNNLSPMTTSGDIIYGGTSGTGTRLAANSTGTNKYLQSVGSGIPAWVQIATSDLSGTLSTTSGGTGVSNPTAHNLLIAEGSSNMTLLAPVAGTILVATSASADPSFSATPTLGVVASLSGTLALASSTASTGLVTLANQGTTSGNAYTFSFPLTGGTNGYALTTNGSGTTTWTSVLTNPMTTGGDLIYGGTGGTPTRLANGGAGTYLASAGGTSAPVWTTLRTPTVQKFTSSSGTYTTPTSPTPIYIRVRMVGGGGGGSGSGTGSPGTGGTGGNSTFGTSLLVANGGVGGAPNSAGGAGGTASLGSGPIGIALTGGSGGGGGNPGGASVGVQGGIGAASPFGGSGAGTNTGNTAGGSGVTNTGAGGGGAGTNNAGVSASTGAGGGAGGYVDAIIAAPSATYSYAVGAAGTAGTAGTLDAATGGAGGSGVIIVEEFYQ